MHGQENLIPVRTEEEARERGRRGGIASGKARLAKKHGKQLVRALLAMKEADPQIIEAMRAQGFDPETLTNEVTMHLRQIDKAKRKADTKAYNSVLRVAGYLDQMEDEAGPSRVDLNITVSSTEAAEGLRVAIENGAQPKGE